MDCLLRFILFKLCLAARTFNFNKKIKYNILKLKQSIFRLKTHTKTNMEFIGTADICHLPGVPCPFVVGPSHCCELVLKQ